jgi:hypothetical protein
MQRTTEQQDCGAVQSKASIIARPQRTRHSVWCCQARCESSRHCNTEGSRWPYLVEVCEQIVDALGLQALQPVGGGHIQVVPKGVLVDVIQHHLRLTVLGCDDKVWKDRHLCAAAMHGASHSGLLPFSQIDHPQHAGHWLLRHAMAWLERKLKGRSCRMMTLPAAKASCRVCRKLRSWGSGT